MQKDSDDIVFRVRLGQYVVQWLGIIEWTYGDSGAKNLQKQSEL